MKKLIILSMLLVAVMLGSVQEKLHKAMQLSRQS